MISSHHESELAEREASPMALRDRRRQTAAGDGVLGALRIHQPQRAANDQAEREHPEEEPIRQSSGEHRRRDPLVALHRSQGNGDRNVSLAGVLLAGRRGRPRLGPHTGAASEAPGFCCLSTVMARLQPVASRVPYLFPDERFWIMVGAGHLIPTGVISRQDSHAEREVNADAERDTARAAA